MTKMSLEGSSEVGSDLPCKEEGLDLELCEERLQ
jgi:hypothetical protein